MKTITLPRPIASDDDTVTLDRTAWLALIDEIESADDVAAADRHEAWVAAVGPAEARRLSYSADEVDRLLNGEPAVVIWRKRSGLSQKALAGKAGISASYLAEIETGKKPGSVAAMSALAKALGVPLDSLVR